MREIAKTWWPLAVSWFLMSLEMPSVTAILSRLPDPAPNLAAFGGIAFPLCMMIEAPIIMLLGASTTLCRDLQSYRKVRSFMIWMGGGLTALHLILVLTPLFDLVVGTLIGAPPELHSRIRAGLLLATPWTWSIAFRRFYQGILIRFGRSHDVGQGTAVRLVTTVSLLLIGLSVRTVPGVMVGFGAIVVGVLAEAAFIGIRSRPVINNVLRKEIYDGPELTNRGFITFYAPLAATSVLYLTVQPMGAAAMSRMPNALESLAVWPVVWGLIFVFRSVAIGLQEVIVAHLDRPAMIPALFRFTIVVMLGTTALLSLIALTPLSDVWFENVAGIPANLRSIAVVAILFGIPFPAMGAIQSFFQGSVLHSRKTRPIIEAVFIYLGTACAILGFGVWIGKFPGVCVALVAFSSGIFLQMLWVSRAALRHLRDLRARA